MHDEQLERRLRAALSTEAARLPMTITSAELERRFALRNRRFFSPRGALLLAAAVGLAAVGVGAGIGGLSDRQTPVPSAAARSSDNPAATNGGGTLPSLDGLVGGDTASLVAAQSHGEADGAPSGPASLAGSEIGSSLGTVEGDEDAQVTYACVSERLQFDIRVPGARGPLGPTGPVAACDGATHTLDVKANGQAHTFSVSGLFASSWRVVLRSSDAEAATATERPTLAAPEGEEALVDFTASSIDAGASPDPQALAVQNVGAVPGRLAYGVSIWCAGGAVIKYLHGDNVGADLVATTVTELPCDGVTHTATLAIPEVNGSRAFIAAAPTAEWTVLVTSETAPVKLVDSEPGWTSSMGYGPDYAFEEHGVSLSGFGRDEAGPVRVVIECVADHPIVVEVQLDALSTDQPQQFVAPCTTTTPITRRTFDAAEPNAIVGYTVPAGAWTAMTTLVPDPAP